MAEQLPISSISRRRGRRPVHGLPSPATLPAIPHNWRPRHYQADVFDARRERGLQRFDLPWHRRAGKDSTGMNFTAACMQNEPGAYWHLFPRLVQAKRGIWNGIDPRSGMRYIDQAFPDGWRAHSNDSDLFLRAHNGSTWQLGGSDSYDRLMGANIRGVVFSEWSLCDPMAWEYIRPILAENGGWAMFIYTFRGKNHAWQGYRKHVENPGDWYAKLLTVNDTRREDGSPVVTLEAIDKERRDGMSEAMIRQEFYCDPIAARPGAVYGGVMTELVAQKRTRAAFDASVPVVAAWNLEHMPAVASVVFFQELGNEVAAIGSRTWTFPRSISECFAELDAFPFEAARHVLRIDDESVWPTLFGDYGLRVEQTREHSSVGKASAVTAAMLERTTIDTSKRAWLDASEETNNELLVDSLNGFRLKSLEGEVGPELWDTVPVKSYEQYLAGAVELYAAWNWNRGRQRRRGGRSLDYSAQDRAVI